MAVKELDRILNREDVILILSVDHINHRRQGRRLARTGRTRDEDETAWFFGQFTQYLRYAKRVEAGNILWHQGGRAALTDPRWKKQLTRKRATPGIA